MPNYSLVLNNRFQNRSFDDLLKPLAMYTDVYNEQENAIGELEIKAGIWENMANQETDPVAYAQYKRYADDLQQQANALAASGLNPQTRRNVLNMKKRYASEIVPIEQAYTALQEERKLRRNNKDQSTLYADDNLSIDSFLGGKTPNLYNVSGNELYQRGAQAAQSASSREYYDTKVKPLTKYYQEMIQTVGYSPELMYQFRQDMAAIPELRDEVYSILKEKGVKDNLTGANYARAMESVINGMVDGAIYKEARNTHQNQGVLTAAQAASNALGWANHNESKRQHDLQMRINGYDPRTGEYNPANDQAVKKAKAIADAKQGANGGSSGGGRSGAAYDVRNKDVTVIGAKTGAKYKLTSDTEGYGLPLESFDSARVLSSLEYASLVDSNGNITNDRVRNAIGNGQISDYEIYVIPKGSTQVDGTGFFNDDTLEEDVYIVKPRETKRSATEGESTGGYSNNYGTNDIPE